MNQLTTLITEYLEHCRTQKRLDSKTLKAYRIDLTQFSVFVKSSIVVDTSSTAPKENTISLDNPCCGSEIASLSINMVENFIVYLHEHYKPRTVRRKIASIRAFFQYLEYPKRILSSPFHQIKLQFRDPIRLPKTIPLYILEVLLRTVYDAQKHASTPIRRACILRDISVIELLFATGIRISELCALHPEDIDLTACVVRIYGKGDKERRIQLCDPNVLSVLRDYHSSFKSHIHTSGFFFVRHNNTPLSDQSVRRMIRKYASLSEINLHITPHMFRHTFATSLLDADVDIRIIQELLGHSSIHITEIYTHVTMEKQRKILATKHPRGTLKT